MPDRRRRLGPVRVWSSRGRSSAASRSVRWQDATRCRRRRSTRSGIGGARRRPSRGGRRRVQAVGAARRVTVSRETSPATSDSRRQAFRVTSRTSGARARRGSAPAGRRRRSRPARHASVSRETLAAWMLRAKRAAAAWEGADASWRGSSGSTSFPSTQRIRSDVSSISWPRLRRRHRCTIHGRECRSTSRTRWLGSTSRRYVTPA